MNYPIIIPSLRFESAASSFLTGYLPGVGISLDLRRIIFSLSRPGLDVDLAHWAQLFGQRNIHHKQDENPSSTLSHHNVSFPHIQRYRRHIVVDTQPDGQLLISSPHTNMLSRNTSRIHSTMQSNICPSSKSTGIQITIRNRNSMPRKSLC